MNLLCYLLFLFFVYYTSLTNTYYFTLDHYRFNSKPHWKLFQLILSGFYFQSIEWNSLITTFLKLSKLKNLYVDSNSFRLVVSSNWVPPFQLRTLSMGSCHIGPAFPAWLRSQTNLLYLDLSNASISSSIPNWFWNISSDLQYLTLSHNQLQGQLPNSNIGKFLPNFLFLSLSGNQKKGTIPDSIGNLTYLEVIDFSRNNLVGGILLP